MSSKFFYAIDERKNDNSKNNVTAFKEHLSVTLFSKLYCLNMKILGY